MITETSLTITTLIGDIGEVYSEISIDGYNNWLSLAYGVKRSEVRRYDGQRPRGIYRLGGRIGDIF